MRRVEHLIEAIRRHTENEQLGVTDGIDAQDFIEILNDGQALLQARMMKTDSSAFAETTTVDVTAGTATVAIPYRLLITADITMVEYSPTGNAKDYCKLQRRSIVERSNVEGHPTAYSVLKNNIVLSCIPQSSVTAGLRITYNKLLPKLDINRGYIVSAPVSGTQITSLTLSTSTPYAEAAFDLEEYMCIVDPWGAIKVYDIEYESVSSGTASIGFGGLSVAGVVVDTPALGDFVTLGRYSTIRSELPPIAEHYLFNYARYRIFERDSSSDSAQAWKDAEVFAEQILDLVAESGADAIEIPILDDTYHPEEW